MSKPHEEPERTRKTEGKDGRNPWLSRRTGAVVMALLSVAVFALVWFSAPAGADWRTSLKVAVVMVGGMWLVFAFTFTLSRWLRSR